MSGGAVTGGAAGAAAAAAARKAALLRQEEEYMTGYRNEEMDGWEFKIVRSNFNTFKNNAEIQKVCQEEAKAGWELLEKFDDQRLRFKRRIDLRTKDQYLNTDPYRTQIGMGDGKLTAIIIGLVVLLAGAVLLTVVLNSHA